MTTTTTEKLLDKLQSPKAVISPTELIDAIKDLKDEDSIKSIAIPFDKWIRSKYSTLKSIRKHMTPFLKALRELPLVVGENAYYYENYKGEKVAKHIFQKYAGLTPKEYQLLNSEAEIKKEQRLTHGTEINPKSYLEKVEKLLLSSDHWELMVGIIAATGRRPHEIAARGTFELATSKDLEDSKHQPLSHWLIFSGQGKKKKVSQDFGAYPIASLFPGDFTVKALARLRKFPQVKGFVKTAESELIAEGKEDEIKKLYDEPKKQAYEWEVAVNKKLDLKTSRMIINAIQRELPEVLLTRFDKNSISASSLRAAYARLATVRDCPRSTNELLWASRLLGHKKSEDLKTLLAEVQDSLKTTERREEINISQDGGLKALMTTAGYFDYYIADGEEVPLAQAPKRSKAPEKTSNIRGYQSDIEFIKSKQEEWGVGTNAEVLRKIIELAKEALEARERRFNEPQEVEENNEEDTITMNKEELIALVEEVIDRKLSAVNHNQSTPASVNTKSVEKVKPISKPASKQQDKNWEDVPSEELKESKAHGSAFEKCKRIVQAIMDYNDYKAPSNDDRWYIGVRSIQECAGGDGKSGLNYRPVKQFLDQFKGMIDDHHQKYGLNNQHNKRHQKHISEVISW